jgi:hypothetical protein
MPMSTRPLLSVTAAFAIALLAGCASAPQKPPAATVAAAAAVVAPAPCQEGPGGPKARVAGGQTVSMTSCARPSAEWAKERPNYDALRPGTTH